MYKSLLNYKIITIFYLSIYLFIHSFIYHLFPASPKSI